MNENKDILNENEALKKEFPLLFALEKKNPFATPDSYFDDAELTISLRINVLHEKENENSFGIPENYFSGLENKIKNAVELEGLKKQSFETPENYFEHLESDVRLKLMLDGLKKEIFTTPVNYFEESAEQMKTAAWLSAFRSENNFAVPQNYFETFEEKLRVKLGMEKKEARVINMASYFRKAKYFAAAAALIGVCIISYFMLKNSGSAKVVPTELSALDKKKIIENPGEFGIDEGAIVDLVNENPGLLASVTDDATSDVVNDLAADQTIDVNTIVGED